MSRHESSPSGRRRLRSRQGLRQLARKLTLAFGCSLIAAIGMLCVPFAHAEVSGLDSDETIQQADAKATLQPATAYSGGFSSAEDIDYLAFDVSQPETLRFDIENTLGSCKPYSIEAAPPSEPAPLYEPFPTCPMWGTLIEANGQQVGGEGSGAGTGPIEYASYEEIEWTFAAAGRYYLVLESDYCGRHSSECQLPTFKFSYGVVPPTSSSGGGNGTTGGGTTGGGTTSGSTGSGGTATKGASGGSKSAAAPAGGGSSGAIIAQLFEQSTSHSLISAVRASGRQRGRRVIVRVVLSQRLASLELGLIARLGRHRRMTLVGHLLRKHPIAGAETVAVPVKAAMLAAQRNLSLTLRIRAQGLDGAVQIVQRHVLLHR